MSKYLQRHIAIQLQYDGVDYQGFAAQTQFNTENTIEKHVFEALEKLKFITDRKV